MKNFPFFISSKRLWWRDRGDDNWRYFAFLAMEIWASTVWCCIWRVLSETWKDLWSLQKEVPSTTRGDCHSVVVLLDFSPPLYTSNTFQSYSLKWLLSLSHVHGHSLCSHPVLHHEWIDYSEGSRKKKYFLCCFYLILGVFIYCWMKLVR